LLERIINLSTAENDIVFDPFGLLAAISCTRCGQNANMICSINEDGVITGYFIANAWKNDPSQTPGDPYGTYGPIPPGTYSLMNDWSNRFQRRLPSPSNTGTPGIIRTPRGTLRVGIRVHRGCFSQGCLTLGRGSEGRDMEIRILNIVDNHRNKGGTNLSIKEEDCCGP
jgi:hypothetical protein